MIYEEESGNFSGSARDVWEQLLEGKKIEISFVEAEVAEKFRVRLHQIKAGSQKHLISIGFMEESEVESLLFENVTDYSNPSAAPESYTYRLTLGKRKREAAKYSFKIVS